MEASHCCFIALICIPFVALFFADMKLVGEKGRVDEIVYRLEFMPFNWYLENIIVLKVCFLVTGSKFCFSIH